VHLPGDGGPYGLGNFICVGVFQQVAGRPGLERAADLGLLNKAGHGHHLDGRPAGLDLAGGGDAVHDRHHEIHQHDVGKVVAWFKLGDAVQGLAAVGGFADHLDVLHLFEVGRDAASHNAVIVDQEDSDGAGDLGVSGHVGPSFDPVGCAVWTPPPWCPCPARW
jgi:hypothetical protein